MTDCTRESLETLIRDRFDGKLVGGCGNGKDTVCILQAGALCQGLELTDDPHTVGRPDIRPLNDASWSSDELRAECLTRVYVALAPWAMWSKAERRKYIDRVIVLTVQRIISELPDLPDERRIQCRVATTLGAAELAADAVKTVVSPYPGVGTAAADVQMAIAEPSPTVAASRIALAVYDATLATCYRENANPWLVDIILSLACQLWIEAVAWMSANDAGA